MADDNATLAWQLRSGSLALAGGHVEPYAPMLATSAPGVVAVVQARADAINAIIDAEGLAPQSMAGLVAIFNARRHSMADKPTSDMTNWIRQRAGRQPAAPPVATPDQVAEARKTAGALGISVAAALKVHCWGAEPGQAIVPGNAGAESPTPHNGGMTAWIRKAAGRS